MNLICFGDLPDILKELFIKMFNASNTDGVKWKDFTRGIGYYEYYLFTGFFEGENNINTQKYTYEDLKKMRELIEEFGWWEEAHEEALFCVLFGNNEIKTQEVY